MGSGFINKLGLQSYNFKVEHIKGKENGGADFLSRAVE